MKMLYFVRHGESVGNANDMVCGRIDSPLTERGREQAALTAARIRDAGLAIDRILYSPLVRARDTALCISAATGIPAREEPRLIEHDSGKWQGTSPRNAPAFLEAKRQFVQDYGGGESMLRLAQRIYNLLDDLKREDTTYLLVGHNGLARVVRSYFENMTNEEYASFGVPNCCVAQFDALEGSMRILFR